MRLISICPSNTELVGYLGLTHMLVGVDDYSDWPESVRTLPKLGPDLSINMDRVQSLKPDLVLASLSVPGMEKNIKELEKRNIPHLIFDPNTLNEIANDLLTLGKHTGTETRAVKVVSRYNEFINDYATKSKQLPAKSKLYWEWWPKPIFTPGGLNWLTEISDLAGGVNIFKDVELASVQTNWEDIIFRNPDHICLAWVGVKQEKMKPQSIFSRENSMSISAVQNKQIHTLEEYLYCRPSPRLLLGLKKLAAIIHPEHFPSFDGKDPLLG
ncbi:cobalamin-binding protein [Bacillus sp. Marseille-P3661]|uniref:cobalamin-binding protein n=1 Tax=Bacillus sp. Marseille-P3661 TaxID=1936234 RepID=UPI000C822CDF|nr:cobalamin-binding protein [Bacillus sp. Marseille-P3661]